MSETIKIDIWSDIACPWCYIGKRKFEAGAAAFAATEDAVPIEVEYHSFELSPDTPVDFEGSAADFLAGHKGLPVDAVQGMLDRVVGIAATVGLDYDYDALHHTNTVKAHQLLHFAKANGRQLELAEVLFRAYFVEGGHVGHDEDLAGYAAAVGLDRDEALAVLAENRYLDAVLADKRQAEAYGIQGVPFFVIDGKYGISGAQDAAAFVSTLTQVAAERELVA